MPLKTIFYINHMMLKCLKRAEVDTLLNRRLLVLHRATDLQDIDLH